MIQEKIKSMIRYREAKHFFEKYNRFLVPGFILGGFIVDFITFRTINTGTAFLLLAVHFILAGSLIAFINIHDSRRIENRTKFIKYARLISPLIVQFNFGALLSASLVFYWFSGALSVSWPFIILLLILMTSNEVLRKYYQKPVVQISVYYFITFSILSLMLPYVFNSISPWLFLLAGFLSIGVIAGYVLILSKALEIIHEKKRVITISVIIIFFFMNALYFGDVIPPIPLSLQEAEVVHLVERSGDGYRVLDEKENIFQRLWPGERIKVEPGGSAYVFASVFAPGELDTLIVHRWEYWDGEQRKWVESHKASYAITGGREGGFRGYSLKTNISEGRWRVSIETKRGQTLGRIKFKVKEVDEVKRLEWTEE